MYMYMQRGGYLILLLLNPAVSKDGTTSGKSGIHDFQMISDDQMIFR